MVHSSQKPGEMLQRALAHQQRGDLVQAKALCRQILSAKPRDFFCLNLLGVIAGQQGHFPQAAEWFAKALAVEPQNAGAHANRGLALQESGILDSALACYDRAIDIQPQFAEAHCRRGVVLNELRRHEEALRSFDKAIATKPDFADAYSNRGNILRELGRLHEALASYDRAVALAPNFAVALSNRGNVLKELKRHDEALASYARAISADADCVEAYTNRGLLLQELEQSSEALVSLDLAIAKRPRFAAAHLHRGNTLMRLKQPEAALASIDRALAIKPDYPEAHCARGSALRQLNQFDAALASHERALALKPDYPEALLNRANVLVDLRRLGEAVATFDLAIALQPDMAAAHFCKSIALLQGADFERGLAEFEWRWKSTYTATLLATPRHLPQPLWLGEEPLAGKTILLHAEQGLGDTIHFCRYVKLVADLGARVILEVQKPLLRLLAPLEGVAQVIATGSSLPGVDFHCPLMSLPLAFKTRLETIPAANPYLRGESGTLAEWQHRLARVGKPRIGLAWSGNPQHANDRNRSIPLAQLIAHLPPHLNYVSLHRKDWKPDLWARNSHPKVLQVADEKSDFGDAAALCECVDLVISVDTSLAHLSAALGGKTWILLPFNADWRWQLNRDDSPWYPTVKLYRQSRIGDWEGVLERVGSDLSRIFAARPPCSARSRDAYRQS